MESISELGTTLAVTDNWSTLHQFQVTANVVHSSPILSILMMERRSSETSVVTRATRRQIRMDGILPNYCSVCQEMCHVLSHLKLHYSDQCPLLWQAMTALILSPYLCDNSLQYVPALPRWSVLFKRIDQQFESFTYLRYSRHHFD
jgi:hypothetical protein